MNEKTHFPEPEILSRDDTEDGRWEVEACAAKRGLPNTNITLRTLTAPVDPSPMSRAIRAHEMMHAKVSPAGEYEAWIKRGIASHAAMTAVEELRVNLLCTKAGFDMKHDLSDEGETADGERIAANRDWQGAVFMSIATVGTASHKKFLTGIRRHDRFWGKCLLDISKRAHRYMQKSWKSGTLASTEVDETANIAPLGFGHTERLAEWVDRIAEQEPPEPPPADAATPVAPTVDPDGEDEGEGEGPNGKLTHSNIGIGDLKIQEGFGERLTSITPDTGNYYGVPVWADLNIETLPLTTLVPGTIGKKRIASNTGRHPRRLHRYLTDPEMRIFDRTIKGVGGVLVLDASGSMSLTKKQIREILQAAPGVTVLAYSDNGREGSPNAWVLARKGRMVEELPATGHGNGVDYPAIVWGVENRQKSSSPVIWVSDGGVCGKSSGFHNGLAMQCIRYCIRNRVIVVPHLDEAVEMLRKMRRGQKGRTIWPRQLRMVYRQMMGSSINDDYPLGW
jgi:hypothetical protein